MAWWVWKTPYGSHWDLTAPSRWTLGPNAAFIRGAAFVAEEVRVRRPDRPGRHVRHERPGASARQRSSSAGSSQSSSGWTRNRASRPASGECFGPNRRDRAPPGDDEHLRGTAGSSGTRSRECRSPHRQVDDASRPSSSCGIRAGRRPSTGSRRTPTASKKSTSGPSARIGARAASPSETAPAHMPTIATAGRPCRCSGTPSSAGAVKKAQASESSSGASFMTSRKARTTSPGALGRRRPRPRRRPPLGSGCSASSTAVTTPKLPPPPRNAQSSSLFSSSPRGRSGRPRSRARRRGVVACEPVLALEPARAAAECQARDARRGDAPAGGGQAVGRVRDRRRPRSHRRRPGTRWSASTSMSVMPRTSRTTPSSHSDSPATECPPARTAIGSRGRGRTRRRDDVVDGDALGHEPRPRSISC